MTASWVPYTLNAAGTFWVAPGRDPIPVPPAVPIDPPGGNPFTLGTSRLGGTDVLV